MLLSRTAEAVYWTGRYLERAEATARILASHTELYLDLPKAAGLGWRSLLAVTGSEDLFAELYDDPSGDVTEEQVVRFLAIDRRNPGSILSALGKARDNLRGTRPLFARSAWEVLNRLYLVAAEDAEAAVHRRGRLLWTEEVVADVQQLAGLLNGTMSHDEVHAFFQLGRQIERADMTTRVLDVRAANLLADGERLGAYADLQWMSVLHSLTAEQTYLRNVQCRVQGADALRFLLQDPQFPRSVEHCLIRVAGALLEVPRHEAAMAVCARVQDRIEEAKVRTLALDGLHEFVDELQEELATLHDLVSLTYFRRPSREPLLASA